MVEDNTIEVAVRGLCKQLVDTGNALAQAEYWVNNGQISDAERRGREITTKLVNLFCAKETALKLVADINDHQANPYVHSLTCGNDSDHGKLVPHWSARLDRVVLRCPTCQREQEHIPTLIPDATPMAQLVERLKSHFNDDPADGDVGC